MEATENMRLPTSPLAAAAQASGWKIFSGARLKVCCSNPEAPFLTKTTSLVSALKKENHRGSVQGESTASRVLVPGVRPVVSATRSR